MPRIASNRYDITRIIARFTPAAASMGLLALAACADSTTAPLQSGARPSFDRTNGAGQTGQVYTASNAVAGNAVLVYDRAADGTLSSAGSVATGGTGTGGGLGNQGAVTLASHDLLLVVNAGSNSLSSFRLGSDGQPHLVNTVPSGGTTPISVTANHGVAYVLNIGGAGNISGFALSSSGELAALPGSTRSLSTGATAAAQIGFSGTGNAVVVTERNTNTLGIYTIGVDGRPSSTRFQAAAGTTPFGFAFSGNTLVTTEAFGGAPGGSAVSSYRLSNDGSVTTVTASVPTTQTSACWLAITGNGRYAYSANTGSSTITGFALSGNGTLTSLGFAPTPTGATAIELAFSGDSRFLYSLSSGDDRITAFAVGNDGALERIGQTQLIDGANGLAAR